LSALAASGGFAPDAPGALAVDRDPPGFEALDGFGSAAPSVVDKPRETAADRRAEEAERRAAEAEQRRIEEEQRKRRLAERERLSSALRDARHLRDSQQRELSRLQAEVEAAEQTLKKSQALLDQIEAELASL
jgi:chromosome segregation ATPase